MKEGERQPGVRREGGREREKRQREKRGMIARKENEKEGQRVLVARSATAG